MLSYQLFYRQNSLTLTNSALMDFIPLTKMAARVLQSYSHHIADLMVI